MGGGLAGLSLCLASRPAEILRRLGTPQQLDRLQELGILVPDLLAGVESVGITSGASTPEILVDRLLEMLRPDEVTHVQSIEEDVKFVLPRELR